MASVQPNTHTNTSLASNPSSSTRWDHSGYDQLQEEENSGEWHHVQRPQKKKAIEVNNTSKKAQNLSKKDRNAKRSTAQKGLDSAANVNYNEKGLDSLKFEDGKNIKKEKRPDRLLYNPRRNRKQSEDGQPIDKLATNDKLSPLGLSKDFNGSIETPTKLHINDNENDKNSPSNVSTAISDRQKNFDEETSNNREECCRIEIIESESSSNVNSRDDALFESNLLFTMCLETENGCEMIPIYKDERDYEEFLNELCASQKITDELAALHFKINLLKVIQEMHPDPSRVEECLDKLLDRNYSLWTSEEGEENSEMSYDYEGMDWNMSSYIDTSSNKSFNLAQIHA